jgi:hypothetical protein
MNEQKNIPIRRLTLYKHGVGFVERAGVVDGAELELTLRAGDVDDALKSLLVIDRRGGAVLGMDYATPGEGRERAGDTFADLSDERSLRDLLRLLRGWSVQLTLGDDEGAVSATGRVLGIDVAQPETMLSHTVVVLLDEEGGVARTVPLNVVRRVRLLDARAERDLQALLDASRGEDRQRAITVHLSPGQHDLAVSYLVPSPTWRVSYRVVAEPGSVGGGQEGAGEIDAEGGSLLLQGWGVFDNSLEEDLDGVDVTLVAGQPISFVYDLSSSRVPERPVVEDEARVATGPVEFAAAFAAAPAPMAAAEMPAMAGAAPRAMVAARTKRAAATIENLSGQATAATGSAAGELFQYEVTAPVSVKRGASALAPILGVTLPYRRELLYNRAKLAGAPVAALRFTNDSGLVLERGPATVLDAGAYHGEAIVPFTREGGEVYLAYAVELGIAVTVSSEARQETAGLSIQGALLHLKSAVVTRTTYRLESSLREERRVTIEHAITPDADLVAAETRAPDARTAEHYHWDAPCAARQATTFAVAERRYTWRSENLADTSYAQLQTYLAERWLDGVTLARLKELFEEREAVARNGEEIAALWDERNELYKRQESLRANMKALGTEGEEGALRGRAVRDLAASEERLHDIGARLDTLKEENRRRQSSIDTFLATLHVEDTSSQGS